MNYIIFHHHFIDNPNGLFMRLAKHCTLMTQMVLDRITASINSLEKKPVHLLIPDSCDYFNNQNNKHITKFDSKADSFNLDLNSINANGTYIQLINGQYRTHIDKSILKEVFKNIDADIIEINVSPELLSYREKVRFTTQDKIAGFSRRYNASARITDPGSNWPHRLYIKPSQVSKISPEKNIPLDYHRFIENSKNNDLKIISLDVAGSRLDLNSKSDLLNILRNHLKNSYLSQSQQNNHYQNNIHQSVRVFDDVYIGNNVKIGKGSVIVGPTIIGNNIEIGENTLIRSSMIPSNTQINDQMIIENKFVFEQDHTHQVTNPQDDKGEYYHSYLYNTRAVSKVEQINNFRTWKGLCYQNHLKRLFDIIAAVIVLTLFSPIIPIIALVIKISSPGPVFFGHKRQGLHGKEFKCWKFRSMVVGADDLQAALRFINEVDGPQFKIEDDPRINGVGHFLRETCLDEIPQFINVLMGEMSLVGPRPSPEKENSLCPPWRDARLSVRPGITGLWQVCRTRQQSQDFQEWVYYDTQYVKNISIKKDLWICWATVKQLFVRFINNLF